MASPRLLLFRIVIKMDIVHPIQSISMVANLETELLPLLFRMVVMAHLTITMQLDQLISMVVIKVTLLLLKSFKMAMVLIESPTIAMMSIISISMVVGLAILSTHISYKMA